MYLEKRGLQKKYQKSVGLLKVNLIKLVAYKYNISSEKYFRMYNIWIDNLNVTFLVFENGVKIISLSKFISNSHLENGVKIVLFLLWIIYFKRLQFFFKMLQQQKQYFKISSFDGYKKLFFLWFEMKIHSKILEQQIDRSS